MSQETQKHSLAYTRHMASLKQGNRYYKLGYLCGLAEYALRQQGCSSQEATEITDSVADLF